MIALISASTTQKCPRATYEGARNIFYAYEPEAGEGYEARKITSFSLDWVWADRRNAKLYKILPHLFVEAEYSIWLDDNLWLHESPETLIKTHLRDNDIALYGVTECATIDDQVAIIKRKGKESAATVDAQIAYYREERCPLKQVSAAFILRRHTPQIAALNLAWWEQICKWSSRDQLSLPYVLWRLGIEPATIPGNFHDLKRRCPKL